MLICLEGIDCAGKTTLARQLADVIGPTEFIDFHSHNGHTLTEHEQRLAHYIQGTGQNIICDRYHWSEEIYGHLYRGESKLNSPAGFWHIDSFLKSRGGLMVLVETDDLLQRLEFRGEDFLHPEHVRTVFEQYRFLEKTSFCGPVAVKSPVPDQVVDMLANIAHVQDEKVKPLANWPMYVGPINPKVVLVGDNNYGSSTHGAFLPHPGSSAEWLINNVVLQADDPSSFGVTNALAVTGEREGLRSLFEVLNHPVMVALGKEANTALREEEVPHVTSPHPRWLMSTGKSFKKELLDEGIHSV